jgi:hypothetical protein
LDKVQEAVKSPCVIAIGICYDDKVKPGHVIVAEHIMNISNCPAEPGVLSDQPLVLDKVQEEEI